MVPPVLADRGKDHQVLRRIVRTVAVAMVDQLARCQRSVNHLAFGHQAVLMNVAATVNTWPRIVIRRQDPDVTIGIDKPAAVPFRAAFSSPCRFDVRGSDLRPMLGRTISHRVRISLQHLVATLAQTAGEYHAHALATWARTRRLLRTEHQWVAARTEPAGLDRTFTVAAVTHGNSRHVGQCKRWPPTATSDVAAI